jgi:hypothetical protein
VLYKLVINTRLVVFSQILTLPPIAMMGMLLVSKGWFLAMSVGEFQRRLHGAKYAQNDLILRTEEPSIGEIRRALQRLAARERDEATTGAAGAFEPGVEDERHLIGIIDSDEPNCVQELWRELRVRRKALETERAYVGWVSRFMQHCGSEDLRQFGEPEIRSFLTQLAVEGNVAPNTQNQAEGSLLFLYQQVFQRELARATGSAGWRMARISGRSRSCSVLRQCGRR